MKLVIAEKPSVAMALAQVVSATARKDGYMEGNGYLVSWCVGHLVRLCDAADYDEKYRKWIYDDLPIIPVQWKKKALEGTRKQFEILKRLMHRKKHYITASVKIKGDGSERSEMDDSDEKEILINDRKRLRNPFF